MSCRLPPHGFDWAGAAQSFSRQAAVSAVGVFFTAEARTEGKEHPQGI